jgi:hypothetical protein
LIGIRGLRSDLLMNDADLITNNLITQKVELATVLLMSIANKLE